MNFGERLRHARLTQGLTQAELAEKTRLHASAIGHFEIGLRLPSFVNLRKLAVALDITSDYLLDLPFSPKTNKNTRRTQSSEESLDYYSLRVKRWKTDGGY